MPKSKKLQKKIERKLNELDKLLNSIDGARAINSDDSETWDSDTLHNLMANLKEALELLDDKVNKRQLDNFGQPIVLEEGLCTLVDEYYSEEEENEEDF